MRGRLMIWLPVNFGGEKVLCVSCLQPHVMCFFKFLRAITSEHDISSQVRSSSPSIFTTISLAGGYDELEISCTSLPERYKCEATSSHERKRTIHEHTCFLHSVSTGWSIMQLQMLHCRYSIVTNVGRNCEGWSGLDFSEFGASHMIRVVNVHFHLLWPFPSPFL